MSWKFTFVYTNIWTLLTQKILVNTIFAGVKILLIIFLHRFTTVQTFSVYWVAQRSETILECKCGAEAKDQKFNPLTTDDECTRHATLAARYQLAQSILKIGFALAKKVG